MSFKSILKPEGSIMASVAAVGMVVAIYNLEIGPVASAHVTDANHPALESSRKKASWSAFGLVSGLFLLTRDGNVAILGYGTIAAMEISYRHGIMADPVTGIITPPAQSQYQNAENVVPITSQGKPAAGVGY